MNSNDVVVRDAHAQDVPALLDIYNEIIAHTTAIWQYEPRSLSTHVEWFEDRLRRGFPILVAETAGELLGYCSYGPFRQWPGYAHTVENSVYLAPAHRGKGVGSMLLTALLEHAKALGVHAVVAGIDADNAASMRLHEKLGFTRVAHFREVGRKFDRWLDLTFYERLV